MSERANVGRAPLPPLPKKQNVDRQFFGGGYASKGIGPVSYTHLDVYKRQVQYLPRIRIEFIFDNYMSRIIGCLFDQHK